MDGTKSDTGRLQGLVHEHRGLCWGYWHLHRSGAMRGKHTSFAVYMGCIASCSCQVTLLVGGVWTCANTTSCITAVTK